MIQRNGVPSLQWSSDNCSVTTKGDGHFSWQHMLAYHLTLTLSKRKFFFTNLFPICHFKEVRHSEEVTMLRVLVNSFLTTRNSNTAFEIMIIIFSYLELTTTRMGFEPTRAEHNGLAVHRLDHSATSSYSEQIYVLKVKLFLFLRELLQWWHVAVNPSKRKKTIAEKTWF